MMMGSGEHRAVPMVDERELLRIYREHVAAVYRYLSRLTGGDRERTDDLTQSVFERLAHLVAAGGALPDRPAAWLTTVARNEFLQAIRHDAREVERLTRVGAWRTPSDGRDVGVEGRVVLERVLRDLPDEYRAALVFRYHDDLPVPTVASLLERSVEATESLLARARRRVRDALAEVDDGR